MKALDILLRVWYAESMKVEFTEQELTIIAYGLEDHIVLLNENIQALGEMLDSTTPETVPVLDELCKGVMQARTETKALLDKVTDIIGWDY